MKKFAVITARAGSKGLKNKNIIDLCGKPMMAYSIEAAVSSGVFDRVIVSTDSEEYGRISLEYGAEVMYRGERLSDDKATTFMVLEDVLGKVEQDYDYFMLLQPTSPMRTAQHILQAIAQFEERFDEFDFMASVKVAEHPAVLTRAIEDDMSMKHFDIDYSNYRRQAYKDYTPNGAIYIAKPQAYLTQKHFYGAKSLAFPMSDVDSVDVDNELEYKFAKLVMEERLKENK